MEAPKCKQCGMRHWQRVCPVPVLVVPPSLYDRAKAAGIEAPMRKNEPIPLVRTGRKPTPETPKLPDGSFDRNAYQREYMRKRRAAEKASK